MRIVQLLINEDVVNTERSLAEATSENIIEILRENLKVLAAYRKLLVNLRGIPELNLNMESKLGRELVEESRLAVLEAVKTTIAKHNLAEALLDSFLLINGYEAADTFNRVFYLGSYYWEKRGGNICAPDREDLCIATAAEKAGQLRREAYVVNRMTFFRDEKAVAAWQSHPGRSGFLERDVNKAKCQKPF
jgi:hypothetical protein